jgi:hypothetical protein
MGGIKRDLANHGNNGIDDVLYVLYNRLHHSIFIQDYRYLVFWFWERMERRSGPTAAGPNKKTARFQDQIQTMYM